MTCVRVRLKNPNLFTKLNCNFPIWKYVASKSKRYFPTLNSKSRFHLHRKMLRPKKYFPQVR